MKEKKDYKKILRYIWMIYAIFSIVLVVFLADRLICKDMMNVSNRVVLKHGWNITINDKSYENVNLEDMVFDTVKKGDFIVLEKTLPSDWKFTQAALCLHNRHTAVSMYVDDKLEYEYGHDRYSEHKTTGSGYLFINFHDEYKGKELRLEYTVTENNAFSRFDEIWISEWENAQRYIITENRLPMIVGCFLVVFGVMMTFILIFAVLISDKYRNVLYLSVFSICIGVWTLCYYNVVIVFALPLYSISLMEYMTLFMAPIPIIAYMNTYVKELNNDRAAKIYKILFYVQLICSVITITLHTTDTVHGAVALPLFQLLFIVHMIFFSYVLHKRLKNDDKMKSFAVVGIMIVAACILYELARYTIVRYTGVKMLEIKGISSFGFIVFIGVLVLDLYQRVTRSVMEEHEKAILVKRAYTDELTQLHNRGYCTEYMHSISEDKTHKYTIINLDLNGLKKVNDTYGHIKGDELICYAAIVMDKTFSADGVVGRMGGDEFIAIIDTGDRKKIEQLIDSFNNNIAEINKQKPDLGLSISYGYAVSDELVGEGPEKVYHLADKRMYEYKKKVKDSMKA